MLPAVGRPYEMDLAQAGFYLRTCPNSAPAPALPCR